MHYLAFVNYHEAIKLIIDNGANVNLKSESKEYPLLIAASKGFEQTVQILV